MKRTILLVISVCLCGSVYAKEGDWTNFLYITTYGSSNYWNATDAYDGGDASNAFNHPEGILATESNVFIARNKCQH